ncbi:MAG: hypothetical protein LBQ28_02955 [Prevotellaceae bacterium]|jgi:hypothetical protein|nr:hypothetical protein [Prevotellaceae bacterium]
MKKESYNNEIEVLKSNLIKLSTIWDGKKSILELKEADYNWRQMEWWAFYFEYQVKKLLSKHFKFPGDKYGNVSFDLKGSINWDLKASAIKTDNHKIILNDKDAMDKSIEQEGYHGEIIALCDVEYNDVNRTFQKWHTELKGGKSSYEVTREKRTSISRYRKTKTQLVEIILIVLNNNDLNHLSIMKQGRNSNGMDRKEKYMLDLENIDIFENYIINFENCDNENVL